MEKPERSADQGSVLGLADWEDIAVNLSLAFSMQNNAVEIKGGDCRERLDRLIHKFKKEDAKACTEKVNINIYEMKV